MEKFVITLAILGIHLKSCLLELIGFNDFIFFTCKQGPFILPFSYTVNNRYSFQPEWAPSCSGKISYKSSGANNHPCLLKRSIKTGCYWTKERKNFCDQIFKEFCDFCEKFICVTLFIVFIYLIFLISTPVQCPV